MLKIGRTTLAVLFIGALIAGCGGSKSHSGSSSNASSSNGDVTVNNGTEQRGHQPGTQDVSTTEKGKEFDATPNFYYFQACGRPCWLPIYPTPKLVKGTSVTDNYPYEHFLGNNGDKVHVVCQVKGDQLQNDAGVTSDVWDRVVIPKDKVVKEADQLTATPDGAGYYAYGNDIWLGNTGLHDIPCK